MKTFLVGLILLQSAICSLARATSPRNVCLQKVNTARAKYAEMHHVANMNELRYNKNLERSIRDEASNSSDCPEPSITSDNNVDVFWSVEDSGELKIDIMSGPDRTIMACVKCHSMDTGRDMISVVVDRSMSPPINGIPGSGCSQFRSSNHNGLCALSRVNTRKFSISIPSIGDLMDGIKEVGEGFFKAANGVGKMALQEATQAANHIATQGKKAWNDNKKQILRDGLRVLIVPWVTAKGAVVGGAVGTVFAPGPGTAAGGAVGGFIGGMLGVEIADNTADILANNLK